MVYLKEEKFLLKHVGGTSKIGGSCHLLEYKDTRILLDMGSEYGGKPPSKKIDEQRLTEVDALIISHAHLDHCGGVPYLVRQGFSSPIYCTYPTRDLMRILLTDAMKLSGNRLYTMQEIEEIFRLTVPLHYHEPCNVGEVEFRFFNAGHILGSALTVLTLNKEKILYTGDFSPYGGNHLEGAETSCVEKPMLAVCESTYGDTRFEARRKREQKLFETLLKTLENNGIVLIPSFAVGRSQEILLMLENQWKSKKLEYPIYFCTGLARKALEVYRHHAPWMSGSIQNYLVTTRRSPFELEKIRLIERVNQINLNEPSVYVAASGMLTGGFSAYIASKIAEKKENCIIFPGYCGEGTPAKKLLDGERKVYLYDFITGGEILVNVRCRVMEINFSAHADQQGLINAIKQWRPVKTCVVHGEREAKEKLTQKIRKYTEVLSCIDGGTHEQFIKSSAEEKAVLSEAIQRKIVFHELEGIRFSLVQGAIVRDKEQLRLVTLEELNKLIKKRENREKTRGNN